MKHKQGTARDQISFSSFEDRISRDNPPQALGIKKLESAIAISLKNIVRQNAKNVQ
jgi:hypothetical protein